jgi:hypothetical protein
MPDKTQNKTKTTTKNSLFTALLKSGIQKTDAEQLDRAFGNEDIMAFIDGLENVATVLATKDHSTLQLQMPPSAEPWQSIYQLISSEITQNNVDPLVAFSQAMAAWSHDRDLQQAITNAIGYRMKVIQDFERQKGSKKRYKSKDYLLALKQLGYSFRMNDINDKIEVNHIPITDEKAGEIRAKMRDGGFYRSHEVEDVYAWEASKNRYHPIKDYLLSISWDGTPYISQLASYFNDRYGMWPVWLRKWLIGACAKVFEAEQNPMLVMDGPQGVGKSEFARWIGSPMMDYFIEAPIDTDDKDSNIRLISFWIWEVSELGATTRKADYEALKGFLTTRKVTVRKPYGRHDISKPALASFVGTINNSSGIFSDPTGSRRFLVSKIEDINWDYSVEIEPEHVWAEAMAAYLANESWKLTKSEYQKSCDINEDYDVADPIEDLVKKFFDLDVNRDDWWIPTSDILAILQDPTKGALRGSSRSNAMGLAYVMTKLGHEKKMRTNNIGQKVRGYTGIQLHSQFNISP